MASRSAPLFPDMNQYLFVYGTLRPSLATAESAKLVRRMLWVGAASAPGRLYDLGEYPGAVLDPNDDRKVAGEVFQLPNGGVTLAALDAYEGYDPRNSSDCMFVRREAEVMLENGDRLQCWVYVYTGRISPSMVIRSGDYLARLQDL